MTTEELVFSLIATAVGSGLAVKVFDALLDWRKGRTTKTAALEAALAEADKAFKDLEGRKRALKVAQYEEIDDLTAKIRALELVVHQLRLELMSSGEAPDNDLFKE